jgi:hypothetical protein
MKDGETDDFALFDGGPRLPVADRLCVVGRRLGGRSPIAARKQPLPVFWTQPGRIDDTADESPDITALWIICSGSCSAPNSHRSLNPTQILSEGGHGVRAD